MKMSLSGIRRRPISMRKTWWMKRAIVPNLKIAVRMITGNIFPISAILWINGLLRNVESLRPFANKFSDKSLPIIIREEHMP